MAMVVRDFMNPQLVYLREGSRPVIALRAILDFGITAVPVLDEEGRPVGVVSLRDIVDPRKGEPRPTSAVMSIGVDDSIASSAAKLADADVHHLVVVDRDGRALGMLSGTDIVRALIGREAKHPAAIKSFCRTPVDMEVLPGTHTGSTV